jgi:hypothetical protein
VKRGKPFLVFQDGTLTACKPISASDLADYIADKAELARIGRYYATQSMLVLNPATRTRAEPCLSESGFSNRL